MCVISFTLYVSQLIVRLLESGQAICAPVYRIPVSQMEAQWQTKVLVGFDHRPALGSCVATHRRHTEPLNCLWMFSPEYHVTGSKVFSDTPAQASPDSVLSSLGEGPGREARQTCEDPFPYTSRQCSSARSGLLVRDAEPHWVSFSTKYSHLKVQFCSSHHNR